jgi:hypothetical protein
MIALLVPIDSRAARYLLLHTSRPGRCQYSQPGVTDCHPAKVSSRTESCGDLLLASSICVLFTAQRSSSLKWLDCACCLIVAWA